MKPFPKLPNPHPDHAGRSFVERTAKEAFFRIAKLWQPSGEENEATHCTVSRFSQHIISKTTGKAYDADDLPIQASQVIDPENLTPEVLTPNWVVLSDQTGNTIPPNALGQKGGLLYYGNIPLATTMPVNFSSQLQSTGTPRRSLAASIPIPASMMIEQNILLMINLVVSNSGGPSVFAIQFDLGGSADTSTGTLLVIVPEGQAQYFFNGIVTIGKDDNSKLYLVPYLTVPSYIHSAGASQTALFSDWLDAGYGNPTGVADQNEDGSINVYLVDQSATLNDLITVEGSISISFL